jgi:hypothetical protein
MSRGVLLFAFNSPKYNYYEMAEYNAKRINHYLNLPVTIVTDKDSLPEHIDYVWDKIITVTPDKSNSRTWGIWINKGRFQAYDLTPYDETLLLDVDYIVNSDRLNNVFDYYDDFCCHDKIDFLMQPNSAQEEISYYGYNSLWATVIAFKKTNRVKNIFECIHMVQKNYDFYMNLHSFNTGIFRNDYALTIALDIVNGHLRNNRDFIPWNLIHIGTNTSVYKEGPAIDNDYTITFDNWQRGKIKKEYINVNGIDFHLINKDLFEGIMHGYQ